jgi:hypothetical protein
MKIIVYEPLLDLPTMTEIRWPGGQALAGWPGRDRLTAIRVLFAEKTAAEHVEKYLDSSCRSASSGPSCADWRGSEDGSSPSGFLLSRLLLREWTRVLHMDRLDIIVSDEPAAKSRLRNYRGLIDAECRKRASSFNQHEIEVTAQSSVLLNRIEVDSAARISCFRSLGDTFRSFGVYGWPGPPMGDQLLARIGTCYVQQGRLWQWREDRLLPVVCTDSTSMFFLQGLASDANLELVLYLPKQQLSAHMEIAETRFGATRDE